jgi:hypothetical protein
MPFHSSGQHGSKDKVRMSPNVDTTGDDNQFQLVGDTNQASSRQSKPYEQEVTFCQDFRDIVMKSFCSRQL